MDLTVDITTMEGVTAIIDTLALGAVAVTHATDITDAADEDLKIKPGFAQL